MKAFKGVDFNDLFLAYREFCKNEKVANSPVDLGEVIAFYNKALADLPDDAKLKSLKPSGAYQVLDGKGERYAEVFEAEHRRIWVPLSDIPDHVQKAFVAAEDKRFFQHKGVDERGIIRAFITNIAQPGRPQGGSTITQQVAKNLLVGDDVTYERKMREMIVASRLEAHSVEAGNSRTLSQRHLSRPRLVGRRDGGAQLFRKIGQGTCRSAEGALLAGITKGPNFYNPERHPDRAQERIGYVLGRMQAENFITAAQVKDANGVTPQLVAYERIRRDSGFHFLDQVAREAKSLGVDLLNSGGHGRAFDHSPGLAAGGRTGVAGRAGALRGEYRARALSSGRRPISPTRLRSSSARQDVGAKPAWQQALEAARMPLYDVHWTPAIVLGAARKGDRACGLALPMAACCRSAAAARATTAAL